MKLALQTFPIPHIQRGLHTQDQLHKALQTQKRQWQANLWVAECLYSLTPAQLFYHSRRFEKSQENLLLDQLAR